MQSIFAWLVCTIEYRNLSPETGHKGDFEISVGRSRDVMLCRFGFALLSKPKMVVNVAALLPHFSFQELKVNGY